MQFINHLLSSNDTSLISLNNLTEDYFSEYRQEFRFINNHIENYGRVPDKETFLARFRDFDIIEVNESDSYLISALVDDYNTRKIQGSFKSMAPLIQAGRLEEAMGIYKDTAENLSRGYALKSTDILRDTSRFDEYVEKTKNPKSYFFSTGLKELDAITNGFDRKEEIVVIVARPGVGKSLVALMFALQAAKDGLKVGLYSGEMTDSKVGTRADTLVSHISNGAINHGNDMVMEQYSEFISQLPTMFPGAIEVITPASVDGPVTTGTLKAFVQKKDIDLLVVDQISLVDEPRGKSNKEKQSLIMRDLKKLQSVRHMPLIVVSQQNREKNDDGSLDTTQIADADEVGRYATIVIFVEKCKDGMIKLHIAKNRDGTVGQVLTYQADINHGKFVYVPEKDGDIPEDVVKSYKTSDGDNYF